MNEPIKWNANIKAVRAPGSQEKGLIEVLMIGRLEGGIPDSYSDLVNLHTLKLEHNRLSGPLMAGEAINLYMREMAFLPIKRVARGQILRFLMKMLECSACCDNDKNPFAARWALKLASTKELHPNAALSDLSPCISEGQ